MVLDERRYPVEFSATGGEYFRIWIVNLALSIVTLGIYSAWAKVRKKRYFYSHTRIDGEGFEYRASPIAILKGRLIAFAALAVFYAVGEVAPLYQLLLWIPLIIGGPWLLVRSLAFNAHYSAYRNIRFRFDGAYKPCLKIIVGYGLLTLFTLGLGYPFLKRRLVQFAMQHHAFGRTRFALADEFKKPFLNAYIAAFALGIVAMVVMIAVIAAGAFAARDAADKSAVALLVPLAVVIFYGGVFLIVGYLNAATTNAVWNHLAIGPVRFESTLRARDVIWLYVSNLVVVVLTLGLAIPWAVVRTLRYRASRTALLAAGSLDSFVQAEGEQLSATGEEVGEMFDIDLAL